MSNFECRLNRRFWRQKNWYKFSKLGGGEVIWTKNTVVDFLDISINNAKNVNLSDIQNDLLSKILLK